MLTPKDIHEAEFKRVFKGYSPEDVDAFLTRIVTAYEKMYRENVRLHEEIEDLRQQVEKAKRSEGIIAETLEVAKETSENLKEAARQEGEAFIKQSQLQAEEMLAKARRQLEAEVSLADRLRQQTVHMREQIRRAVQTFFDDMDQYDTDLEAHYERIAEQFSDTSVDDPVERYDDEQSTRHVPAVDDTAVGL